MMCYNMPSLLAVPLSTSSKKTPRRRSSLPRPHPSHRLNKRYWDDVRAGRTPTEKRVKRTTSSLPSNTVQLPLLPPPIPPLPLPSTSLLPSLPPLPIYSHHLPLFPLAPQEEEIDVCTVDEEQKNLNPTELPVPSGALSGAPSGPPRTSDADIDTLMDEFLLKRVKRPVPVPFIPFPIPVPVFIPVPFK